MKYNFVSSLALVMGRPVWMPPAGVDAPEVVDTRLHVSEPVTRELVNDCEEVGFRSPSQVTGLGEEGDLAGLRLPKLTIKVKCKYM